MSQLNTPISFRLKKETKEKPFYDFFDFVNVTGAMVDQKKNGTHFNCTIL